MADIESYVRLNIAEPTDYYEEELFKPLLRHGKITDEQRYQRQLAHRTVWFFGFLSGSDDYEWAAIAALDAAELLRGEERLKYVDYHGPLFEKGIGFTNDYLDRAYTNTTVDMVFWGLSELERYFAIVSMGLDITLKLRLYLLYESVPSYFNRLTKTER